MSRYPDFRTPEGIGRRLAEGRGLGRGETYKPYFTRFDVRTRGERRETYSYKCRRSVHLLSRLEFHLFLIAEADPAVVDIREQFPCPLGETQQIARKLGIRHPKDWKTGSDIVVVTALVLTKKDTNGDCFIEAWSVLQPQAWRFSGIEQKQRLEMAWHLGRGHRWRQMTREDVPPVYVSNLVWLHPLRRPDALLGYSPDLPIKVDDVMRRLMRASNDLLWRLANQSDLRLGYANQNVSLYVCRYLLSSCRWTADLCSWRRDTQPLQLLPEPCSLPH